MNGKPLGPEWKLEHGDEKGTRTKNQDVLVIEQEKMFENGDEN